MLATTQQDTVPRAGLSSAAVIERAAQLLDEHGSESRNWALQHPGQYPLTVRAPAPDNVDDVAVSAASVAVIFAVLVGYSLRDDDAVDATRFLRSALHGFVSLKRAEHSSCP